MDLSAAVSDKTDGKNDTEEAIAGVRTTTARPVIYDPDGRPRPVLQNKLGQHICCAFDVGADRLTEGPYPGLSASIPKATNKSAAVDAGCYHYSKFPMKYTKEIAVCNYCACLWRHG